jgi:hypothetical protein
MLTVNVQIPINKQPFKGNCSIFNGQGIWGGGLQGDGSIINGQGLKVQIEVTYQHKQTLSVLPLWQQERLFRFRWPF